MGRRRCVRPEDVLYPCGMLLADFIAVSIDCAAVDLAKQRTKVRRSLQSFLGSEYDTADVTLLSDSAFIRSYEDFLLTAYTPTDNNGRVITILGDDAYRAERRRIRRDSLLTRLRSIVNSGIDAGILPDVDAFSALPDFCRKKKAAKISLSGDSRNAGDIRRDRVDPFWAVVLVKWPDTAELLERRLSRSEDAVISALSRDSIYCPCRSRLAKVTTSTGHAVARRITDERRSVLRNTLFVRATEATLKRMQASFPEAWIMRRRGEDHFVCVPPKQLLLMRNVLDVFGASDDVDIIFEEESRDAHTFECRELVVLHHPDFAGQVAAVISKDKRRSTDAVQYYKVKFISAAGISFTLSMPSALLESIEQQKYAV